MKRQISFIIIVLSIGLLSCRQSGSNKLTKNVDPTQIPLDSIIYNNFVNAVKNESTFQFYLVAKIKDIKSGETREICTTGYFLEGALHTEYKISYDSIGLSKLEDLQIKNRLRYFEFKDNEALNNLGLDKYSVKDLKEFEESHNIDSLAKVIKKSKWSMRMQNDKTMLLYAHTLFNRGILTGENNCFGGTLYYISQQSLDEENRQIEVMKKQMNKMKNR